LDGSPLGGEIVDRETDDHNDQEIADDVQRAWSDGLDSLHSVSTVDSPVRPHRGCDPTQLQDPVRPGVRFALGWLAVDASIKDARD
jgi:hypothetical protein